MKWVWGVPAPVCGCSDVQGSASGRQAGKAEPQKAGQSRALYTAFRRLGLGLRFEKPKPSLKAWAFRR